MCVVLNVKHIVLCTNNENVRRALTLYGALRWR